jgi:hypothetical protein
MAEHLREPLLIPRQAWIHGSIALTASVFGFLASYVYLRRSVVAEDPWALKMAMHMAAWHLLLVVTLFPVSVLGKRNGIHVVQLVSAVFFVIHVAIALANTDDASLAGAGMWIAIFNGASGLFFAGGAAYGWRA